MKNYFEEVNAAFSSRRKLEDKKKFREYVAGVAREAGYACRVEPLQKDRHHNIIVGDCNEADVIFTAHYDTPATSLFPNIMMPRNPIFHKIYSFAIPFLYAMIALAIARGIQCWLSLSQWWAVGIYVVLYVGIFYLAMFCFENKHNYNDNTSGVAALLTAMSIPSEKKVAFIFFDNEEKGLLGSKAFAKTHPEWKGKLFLNLDCVGNGEEFLFVAKPAAQEHPLYSELTQRVQNTERYRFHFFSTKGSTFNSDNKSLEISVGISACKAAKFPKFYTPRIHTPRDVVANSENVAVLAEVLMRAVNS